MLELPIVYGKTDLELIWIGKEDSPNAELQVLLEPQVVSHCVSRNGNQPGVSVDGVLPCPIDANERFVQSEVHFDTTKSAWEQPFATIQSLLTVLPTQPCVSTFSKTAGS